MRSGIVVDSLGLSQLSIQLITELNKLDRLNEYVDIIVFYHRFDRLLKSPYFGMLQEQELWGYDAPVMATDLYTANLLIKCPRPTKKFFYVWDLEWIHSSYDVEMISNIYCNKNIDLIARSKSHSKIISDCWKEPVAILEDFNYEQLTEIFRSR